MKTENENEHVEEMKARRAPQVEMSKTHGVTQQPWTHRGAKGRGTPQPPGGVKPAELLDLL